MARLDPTGVSRILGYIKNWVTTALGGKANSSHSHTKSQITDFPTIPSNTSQLTNDSGYITSSGSCNYANSAGSAGSASTAGAVSTSVADGSVKDLVYAFMAGSDAFRIRCGGSGDNGYVEIATSDNGNESIYVRQYNIDGGNLADFTTIVRTLTLLDGSGNTTLPGTVTAPTFSGNLSGNAATATYANSAGSVAWSNVSDKPTIPTNTNQLTNGAGYITSSGSCNYANSAGYVQGNNNSANAANALLRSGSGRTDSSPEGDTWIFLDEIGGSSAPWGFKHNQAANTIGFYGAGTETSSINLSNGYFSGSCNYANSSGNADTVDGSHAWQMQTLAAGGGVHGSNDWLMQCQHNVDGDGYFKLYCGDKSVGTKVDRANGAGWADGAGSVTCNVPDGSYYAPLSGTIGSNDNYRIRAGGGNNAGELWIETADDGNEPIGFAQYTGTFASVTRYGYLLNSSGNTEFPGTLFTYNGAIIRRNGIPTPGWGMDANTQSVLQIRTEDNTEPSICLHRSGYSHIVLAEQGGQFGVHAQGGTFDRCNTESNTVLNGYRIYVG